MSRDPFLLVLFEQVGYLATDAARRAAFAELIASIGRTPRTIAAAPERALRRVARLGGAIAVAERAKRMRWSARHVLEAWEGDLRAALRLPLGAARKALARFPMIGEPGAEKILVMTGVARRLPLDSNGLRVLQRLGVAPDENDYRTAYRQAQAAIASELPRQQERLVEGYSLLRTHGLEVCRRSMPRCTECSLRSACPWPAARTDRQ